LKRILFLFICLFVYFLALLSKVTSGRWGWCSSNWWPQQNLSVGYQYMLLWKISLIKILNSHVGKCGVLFFFIIYYLVCFICLSFIYYLFIYYLFIHSFVCLFVCAVVPSKRFLRWKIWSTECSTKFYFIVYLLLLTLLWIKKKSIFYLFTIIICLLLLFVFITGFWKKVVDNNRILICLVEPSEIFFILFCVLFFIHRPKIKEIVQLPFVKNYIIDNGLTLSNLLCLLYGVDPSNPVAPPALSTSRRSSFNKSFLFVLFLFFYTIHI
jgi:hypothetical protein